MWPLRRVSIGVGEFYSSRCMIFWGAPGWETFASGKPLLQVYRFHDSEFEELWLTATSNVDSHH